MSPQQLAFTKDTLIPLSKVIAAFIFVFAAGGWANSIQIKLSTVIDNQIESKSIVQNLNLKLQELEVWRAEIEVRLRILEQFNAQENLTPRCLAHLPC